MSIIRQEHQQTNPIGQEEVMYKVRPTYWHGGRKGIQRGAYILPPTVTKVRSLSDYGAESVHRRDRVYVTTSQAAALMYAAGVKNGVIYECEPVGDLEPDPDCATAGLSWQCEKARVIRCIKPKALDIEMVRSALLSDD